LRTTINIDNDNVIWDDPDLDFVLINSTAIIIPNNSTTSIPFDHFDFTDEMFPSSTIIGGLAVEQQNLSLNWWDMNDTLLSPPPLTSNLISSNEDDWVIFNTTSISSITRFEHLSADDDTENNNEEISQTAEHLFTFDTDSNSETDVNMNDYILFPVLTTPTIDLINNNTQTFLPPYFTDNQTKDQLLDYMKPLSTLAMPPFAWMLNLAVQNKSELQNGKDFLNSTTQQVQLETTTSKSSAISYEYCKNKQCNYGGRLNSDCLCICLPTFTGDNCETGRKIYYSKYLLFNYL
jgi:hypothetical protein